MRDLLRYCFFLLFFLFPICKAFSEANTKLVCFSLNAAKRIIEETGKKNMDIDSVGFISEIWAVVLDSINNDLIVVGSKDKSKPSLFFDDVILSLKNLKSLSSKDNPGVSIEPIRQDKYNPYQKIVYFGGIENTHTGWVFFKSDLLLKYLSLGYKVTNINGFPSEWDLDIDNQKAGRVDNPWGSNLSRSYFYPAKVRIANKADCATLLSINIKVISDVDKLTKFPKSSLGLDYKKMKEVLNNNPSASSAVFSKIFTEHFDQIANQYSVLYQLQNLMALPALLSSILKTNQYHNIDYWVNEFVIEEHKTPETINTLSRTVSGVKYGTSVSGGMMSTSVEENDPWTELVLSKDPEFLKEGAIKSRPNENSLYWFIPLGFGQPIDWNKSLIDSVNAVIIKNKSILFIPSFYTIEDLSNIKLGNHINWKTSNRGKSMLEFNSSLLLDYGGKDIASPMKKYKFIGDYSIAGPSVYASETTMGVLNSFEISLFNKISFSIDVPLSSKIYIYDAPSTSPLPGAVDNFIVFAAGIENPILTNTIQLYSGIYKGRHLFPSLELTNSLGLPFSKLYYYKVMYSNAKIPSFPFEFGTNKTLFSNSLSSILPINYSLSLAFTATYQREGDSNNGDKYFYAYQSSIRMKVDKSFGFFIALNFKSEFNKETTNWMKSGQLFSLSAFLPKKNVYNVISIGYYIPTRTEPHEGYYVPGNGTTLGYWVPAETSNISRGIFMMNLDLSGIQFSNKRFWF